MDGWYKYRNIRKYLLGRIKHIKKAGGKALARESQLLLLDHRHKRASLKGEATGR